MEQEWCVFCEWIQKQGAFHYRLMFVTTSLYSCSFFTLWSFSCVDLKSIFDRFEINWQWLQIELFHPSTWQYWTSGSRVVWLLDYSKLVSQILSYSGPCLSQKFIFDFLCMGSFLFRGGRRWRLCSFVICFPERWLSVQQQTQFLLVSDCKIFERVLFMGALRYHHCVHRF